MKLSQLKTNPTATVEVEIGGGLFVTVRSTATPEYRALQAQLVKPLSKYLAVGLPVPPATSDEITAKLLSEVACVSWRGLTNDDDDPTATPPKLATEIPYSKEKAYELFKDPSYAQFRDLVFESANAPATFRDTTRSNLAGN